MALHGEKKQFQTTREDVSRKSSLPFYKLILYKTFLFCLWKKIQDIRKHIKEHNKEYKGFIYTNFSGNSFHIQDLAQ